MPEKKMYNLYVNDEEASVVARPSDTLLHVLRDQLGLTGAKPGCENGDCDACTVLVDGKPIKSCLMLAIEAEGKHVKTIEGLKNTRIQKAFVENWAIQCGYCTPGFIMNGFALLNQHSNPDSETINDWLSGNLCRCMGYAEIKAAIKSVMTSDHADKSS
ncbi:(2Fe-2S)-binding protein [Fictibacillus gelatini]|uniref:(2Fe-2S)-binding protein n=1 Tax=Fictibacillus gelatini TaxID=225985 RepID=UPI0003F9492D|nr:(2Fe-2S)-binding protein [Fictibacillus gelatini]